jgi:hypothetical protein
MRCESIRIVHLVSRRQYHLHGRNDLPRGLDGRELLPEMSLSQLSRLLVLRRNTWGVGITERVGALEEYIYRRCGAGTRSEGIELGFE